MTTDIKKISVLYPRHPNDTQQRSESDDKSDLPPETSKSEKSQYSRNRQVTSPYARKSDRHPTYRR